MRCPHCNAELQSLTKFCPKCGGQLQDSNLNTEDNPGAELSEASEEAENGTEHAEGGSEYVENGLKYAEDGTEHAEDGSKYAEDSTEHAEGSSEYAGDGTEHAEGGSEYAGDGTEHAEGGSEYVEGSSEYAEDGSEYTEDGSGYQEDGSIYPEEPNIKKGSAGKKILAGCLILLAVACAAGGAMFYKHHMDVKRQHERLLDLMEGSEAVDAWMGNTEKRFGTYILTEEEDGKLSAFLKEEKGLEEKDYSGQILLVESVKAFETGVKTRLDTESAALLDELKNQDPGYASDAQKTQLADYAAQMEKLIADGKYKKLEPLAAEWKEYAASAAVKKTGYEVSVMQYDFSEYPTVRVYLDVRDPAAGGIVKELSPNMFYVSERDAGNGDFLNRSVQKAVQMNENERLNINLLADTSSSMMGSSMDSAKNIMRNFLNTVQFASGDQVKLTQFNSEIDKSGYFTNDVATLNNTINGYSATGQTKLYDTIIYGVQDVAGQEGARCVLAFTDGMDVGSYNSAQDVINVVSRYKIPVFIVRIGDSSNAAEDSALIQIAQASGGSFKNMSQFSSDMNDFYNQIYRQLKEYYVVEYVADGMQGVTNDKEISVYVQNQEKGGEALVSANPGDELFDSLLGSYLRSYINDMNNHSYGQLKEYVDDTVAADDKWSIQWQMKKQVTGGFSNVAAETLMDYSLSDITVQDENTIRIKAVENYDVIYNEVYGDLKSSNRTVAEDTLKFLQSEYGYDELDDDTQLKIWARVNQIPEYILKKGSDGKWKFSQYAGDLALGERRKVYDVEVTWQPYVY